jgi:hypothetical protein
MQPVAGRVPVSEYEPAAGVVQLVERVHGEPHFKEDGNELDLMRIWTFPVIDATQVRHMGLVIRRVEVLTIPAGLEEYLCSKTIRAICVVESWRLRLGRAVEVDALFGFVSA